jgi:proteasome lid subunit RPN8/RPN11
VIVRLRPLAYSQIVEHALDQAPVEACGLLIGRPGGPIERYVASRGDENTHDTFQIDVACWQGAKAFEQIEPWPRVLGVAHSHPVTTVWPSSWDVNLAQAPEMAGWVHVIFSVRHASIAAFTFWRGLVMWHPVEIRR